MLRQGFTLLELSVVLVIIGLIVGGVVVGVDLVRSAAIRATVGQYDKIINAVTLFEQKYDCVPGDCKTATRFFGTNPAGCLAGTVSAAPSTATCDGDGNSQIYGYTVSAPWMEPMFFWQHLSAAGMIEGTYSGHIAPNFGSYMYNTVGGVNAMSGVLENTAWTALGPYYLTYYMTNYSGWFLSTVPPSEHSLLLGGYGADWNFYSYGAAIRPIDAMALDTKLDDGKPATGKIQAWAETRSRNIGWTSACTTNTALTSTYRTTDLTPTCALMFIDVFN